MLPNFKFVKVNGFSTDVNHCLYIPFLGVKYDIFEERGQEVLIIFDTVYERSFYYFVCYEYCGRRHPDMLGIFLVLDDIWFTTLINLD